MRFYKNKRLLFFTIILFNLLIFSASLLNFYNQTTDYINSTTNYKNNEQNTLKNALVFQPIHIDNNWSEARLSGICSGDGTYTNPYSLEDLEIDGGLSTNCIFIENTVEYFKIENCTLINAGEWDYSEFIAGIKLENASNGMIINNTCHFNDGDGILLNACNNLTIYDNNLNSNQRYGLISESCNNLTIKFNRINLNTWPAMGLDNSTNSSIFNNILIDNGFGEEGLNLDEDTTNITIYDNLFINNNLDLSECYYIDILNNTFTDCYIDFFGKYDYLNTITVDIRNKINGLSIYQYKNEIGLNFENFTNNGLPSEIILVNCNNSIINNLNFSSGLAGICVFDSNHIKISNCNLTNNHFREGISLSSVFNVTIINNTLSNNRGISIAYSCHNSTFYNNSLSNTGHGIEFNGDGNYNNISNNFFYYVDDSSINFDFAARGDNNWILNNRIIESNGHGIQLNGKENILSNNVMTNCGVQINAPQKEYAATHSIDFSNTINGKPIYYYGNKENLNPVNFTEAGEPAQIILGNCSKSQITGFTISDSSVGLNLLFCDNNTITGNTFSENSVSGISLIHSVNNSIIDNDLNYNYESGIELYEFSNFNNITNNRLNNNLRYGVYLHDDCNNNSFSYNTIINNDDEGIFFQFYCINNTIIHNTINFNSEGISFDYFCNYNFIKYNDIKHNLNNGIYLEDCNQTLILGNEIHFNGHGYRYSYIIRDYVPYDGHGVELEESFNNTVTKNIFFGNKFDIIEVDCNYNKIYNNTFLILPVGDGENDGRKRSHEDDILIIIIYLIIIISACALAAISLYHYRNNNKKKKISKKLRFQESNRRYDSVLKAKDILLNLTDKKSLLQIFDIKKLENINDKLNNLDLTTISLEFLEKLDSLEVEEDEKIEFLKEMLMFSPFERNEILKNIIKRLKSYSGGEKDAR